MHSSQKKTQKTNLNQVQIEYAHAFTFCALKSFSKLKATNLDDQYRDSCLLSLPQDPHNQVRAEPGMSPFIPSPIFHCPFLWRCKLNQLNGHAAEALFWFTVSPTELNRSALVTSSLTLSSLLMCTQEGWLHRGCDAYLGSEEAELGTCSMKYDLEQRRRARDCYSLHFFPLFSPADVAEFAALLNHLSVSLLDTVACLVWHRSSLHPTARLGLFLNVHGRWLTDRASFEYNLFTPFLCKHGCALSPGLEILSDRNPKDLRHLKTVCMLSALYSLIIYTPPPRRYIKKSAQQ